MVILYTKNRIKQSLIISFFFFLDVIVDIPQLMHYQKLSQHYLKA